jgi:FkbM family methyltransferase
MKYFKLHIDVLLARVCRSIVSRSGIKISLINKFKEDFFWRSINNETIQQIQNFRKLIVDNFNQSQLNFLGRKNLDGSYPVLKNRNYSNKTLVSCGVGSNILFEKNAIKLGLSSYSFDHTVNMKIPTKYKTRIKFYPTGITGLVSRKGCMRLPDLFMKFGIDRNQVEILKLDIEGCEWDVLFGDINFISSIPQIIIEFHDLDKIYDPKLSVFYLKIIESLLKTHSPIYISPNNYSGFAMINDLVWPFTLELTFASNSILNTSNNFEFNFAKFQADQVKNWYFGPDLNLSMWFK